MKSEQIRFQYSKDDISRLLKAFRKKTALTQKELSARLGLSQSKLPKIEKGALDLKLREFFRFIDLFIVEGLVESVSQESGR